MRATGGAALQREMAEAIAPAVRAIAASLGPEGRHVMFAVGNRVEVAHSGSDIARQICSDHFAARLFKETLVEAEREFGDGTARLAVMAGAALTEGRRALASGLAPARLLDALLALRPALDAAFAAEATAAEDLFAVALSAGAPADLAQLIVEADRAVGDDGLVEVAEGREDEPALSLHDGFSFQSKAVGAGNLTAMDDVHLIVANERLDDFRSLTPVVEGFARSGKGLVVVARAIEGQALQLIERNRREGVLRVAALVPEDTGPRAAEILEDLAVATGAVLVSDHTGVRIESLKPAMLGRAQSFRREGQVIRLGGTSGDAGQIALRLAGIAAEVEARKYLPLDREHAARRHARLAGRWAELRIAGSPAATTSVAAARRSIAALRSARANGVIEGAGKGLDRIALRLEHPPASDPAKAAALAVLTAALRAPGLCLRRNAGADGPLTACATADPAALSRNLLDVALSLACQLVGLHGAVLRH
ncbi:hypothetical protein LHP98_17630 [Rhodobacter sp. Har01]|uniref:TCP-1/cpn60 chaperonin family protein n=1 Tax=Rhodobacter sp. Har01 TaxID=2883999 RepID=UPI001D062DBD|nr:TCP-1/cpn60 chaperonin family protein [Rhodobacter sp. Har01]MCB6179944.1 hypothetical protein [Rhodobacter sp. Har01]